MKRIASIFKTKKARKEAKKAAEQIDRLFSANGQFCPTSVRVERTPAKVIITEGVDEYPSHIPGLEKGANNPAFRHYLCQALIDRSFQPTGGALVKRR